MPVSEQSTDHPPNSASNSITAESKLVDSRQSLERLPISVSIIASNAADKLQRCLASVADWVTEIVVVVNDCTDDTVAVAESFGAHVHEHEWHGFRDQKNIALKYPRQPWVLALDTDEVVSPELQAEIITFFQQDAEQYQGVSFPRKDWFLGRWITHGDWYPDRSLRLFRADSGMWGGSPEHDKIILEGRCKSLSADLLHYSNPTLNSQISKINVFSDVFLQRQLDAGKRWSLMRCVFRSAWRFLRAYFLRLGFLDGFPGFYIAVMTAFSTFVRYSRLYEHSTLAKTDTDSPKGGRSSR